MLRKKAELAKAITAYCFRNAGIENAHAGAGLVSNTGDFSDVLIVDANGNNKHTGVIGEAKNLNGIRPEFSPIQRALPPSTPPTNLSFS